MVGVLFFLFSVYQLIFRNRVFSIVGVRLRQLYDQCEWVLIPEESVIQKYHESLILVDSRFYGQRKKFPEFPVRHSYP